MKFTDLFLGQNRSQVLHSEWHHSPRQAAALLQGLRALEASHLLAPPGCRNVRCRAFRAFPGCDDIVRLDRFWSAGLLSFGKDQASCLNMVLVCFGRWRVATHPLFCAGTGRSTTQFSSNPLKIIEIFLSLKSNQSISVMFLIFISGKPLILHLYFSIFFPSKTMVSQWI